LFPIVEETASSIRMAILLGNPERKLQDVSISDTSQCIEVWKVDVEERIKEQVEFENPGAEMVAVEVTSTDFDRLLSPPTLVHVFDVALRIRAPPAQHDVLGYVERTFDSEQEKEEFIAYLRESECAEYRDATAVALLLPTTSPSQTDPPASTGKGSMNTGLIVGIVLAVFAAVMLLVLFGFVRLKGRRSFAFLNDDKKPPLDDGGNEYASEIGYRVPADVSTLSDPVPIGLPPTGADMATTGSFSLDYDYQKAYQPSVSEVSGSLLDTDTDSKALLSADDDSLNAKYGLDETFEILAPRGMLGLILETNADGVPVVNDVKLSSVLYGQVQSGDRLLTVDDIDVTLMLASDVSKLIASRKNRPERKLVFARTVKQRGAVPVDVDGAVPAMNEDDVNDYELQDDQLLGVSKFDFPKQAWGSQP